MPPQVKPASSSLVEDQVSLATVEKSVSDQIRSVIERFPETTAFGFCRDDFGSTASCCVAATAFLSGAVHASQARLGIHGVLDVIQTKWPTWGTARCWTACQCFDQQEIDCGSLMNVGVLALAEAKQVTSGNVIVAKVQVVRRWDLFQAAQRRSMYDNMDQEDFEFLTSWIEDSCYYHQCIGLISPTTGHLRIWDTGLWVLPPTNSDLDRATLAIRLTPSSEDKSLPSTVDWGGLTLPTGSWYTLLDQEYVPGIPNVSPLKQNLTKELQLGVLERVFNRQASNDSIESGLGMLEPTILISGTHMGENPCPGVGVSRAIRLRFPKANILAIDGSTDVTTGLHDATFDAAVRYDTIMMSHLRGKSKLQYCEMVQDYLNQYPEAFYIPCTDHEVERCAGPEIKSRQRVLSPSRKALAATDKPHISGAVEMGIFHIPPFIELDTAKYSQLDIETFCKLQGYPVYVKGPKVGASHCNSWKQVQEAISSKLGAGGYVQKTIAGFQLGLAFAAYEGEITAAILMEKTAFNSQGKAWAGHFRKCSRKLLAAVRRFCSHYKWTGGGEIEFVEDAAGQWWAIDFNPRFPAWIFGGCYGAVNVPAALIQHALHTQSFGLVPYPQSDRLAGETANGGFTRTVVEIPVLNTPQFAVSGIRGFPTSSYTKAGAAPHSSAPLDMLPQGIKISSNALGVEDESKRRLINSQDCQENEAASDISNKEALGNEISRLLPKHPTNEMQTPMFVLSRESVQRNLCSHRDTLRSVIDGLARPLKLQMCLSIKTQPHAMVLEEAQKAGYKGEVITSAEMRACLDAGWGDNSIVMNGPGKWYDTPARQTETLAPVQLGSIFADSLSDLETIVDRVMSPDDWLDANVIGIRFAPVWVVKSRFGLDCKDPKVLRRASELIQRLPKDKKLGLHMHFASSTLGLDQWFGLSNGFLEVCRGFADMCGREPVLLDFGGGWPSSLLDSPAILCPMHELLASAQTKFPLLETVQFEPGKAITERAGAVVTKILEIREVEREVPRKVSNKVEDEVDGDEDTDSDFEEKKRVAMIVDACISDMGSTPTHVHPLLWKQKGKVSHWQALSEGKDLLYGSICMEFDILGSNIEIPSDAEPGDLILIGYCGAYDMTMSYDFADGLGRSITVLD